jgi:murein DD-endopeptidase MepM/ murein hydrolase activator NlpD
VSKHRAARRIPRHRPSTRGGSLAGGALLLAAVGAVSLGPALQSASAHPISSTGAGAGAASQPVLAASVEPGDLRGAPTDPRVSRGIGRSSLGETAALKSAAQARANARSAALESAAAQARAYARELASRTWTLPTSGFHVSTWFGEAGYRWASGYHTGIDLATACGTPIVAVSGGTVTRAGWDGPYGYQVRERLPNGDQIWYNHMTVIQASAGAGLDPGSRIGLVGETGNAYGCHLHLEYRLGSDPKTPVDPAPFFAAHGIPLR